MLLVVLAVLVTAHAAVIDPSRTEWTLIAQGDETIKFPLKDYILEIKSFRPDHPDDPLYAEGVEVDKSSSMLMELRGGGEFVSRVVWNTIDYVTGKDVHVFECKGEFPHLGYKRYFSKPCNGNWQQIWAWDFNYDDISLTCDGEEQYHVDMAAQSRLWKTCAHLRDSEIDTIRFTNMGGFYYKAVPRDGVAPDPQPVLEPEPEWTEWTECSAACDGGTTERTRNGIDGVESDVKGCNDFSCLGEWSEWAECSVACDGGYTERARNIILVGLELEEKGCNDFPCLEPDVPEPDVDVPEPDVDVPEPDVDVPEPDVDVPENLGPQPACNCWNKECGWCADLACAVKYDVSSANEGICIESRLKPREPNAVLFFNEAGNALGSLQLSARGIYLTGCMNCRAPPALRKARGADGNVKWNVKFVESVLQIHVGEEMVFEQELLGECAAVYSEISYFSFSETSCTDTFEVLSNMQLGANMDRECAGTCPVV